MIGEKEFAHSFIKSSHPVLYCRSPDLLVTVDAYLNRMIAIDKTGFGHLENKYLFFYVFL